MQAAVDEHDVGGLTRHGGGAAEGDGDIRVGEGHLVALGEGDLASSTSIRPRPDTGRQT